jgi:hypothetical protein
MKTSRHQPWFLTALLVGAVYFLIGKLFALPTDHVQAWRLAAWVASAAVFAAHLGYEYFRLGNSPRSTALHAAIAVSVGAFGLAVAATVHSWLVPSTTPPVRFLLALIVWPAVTALPAFLVAYVAIAVLARLRPRV